jgi:hypothetical protein
MGYIENLNEIMSIKEQLKTSLGLQSNDFAMYPELINKSVEEIALEYDMTKNYFTIEVTELGQYSNSFSINISIDSSVNTEQVEYFAYSKNDSEFTIVPNVNAESVNIQISNLLVNDKVRICGKAISLSGVNITFSNLCTCKMYGNIMSLLKENDFENTTLSSNNALQELFSGQNSYIYADQLVLPSNVTEACYYKMFYNSRLVTPPQLPATTLAPGCYESMFDGCTELSYAPALPSTSLKNYCYESMFARCSSLKSLPKLNATSLYKRCYRSMFSRCTSLTIVDCFSDVILNMPSYLERCFYGMFADCTNINYITDIHIDTIYGGNEMFASMFSGCTKLVNGPIIYVNNMTSNNAYFDNIFSGCTALKRWGFILQSSNDYYRLNANMTNVSSYGTLIVKPLATNINYITSNWVLGRYFITDNKIYQYFDTYDNLLDLVSSTNGYINTEALSMTNADYNALFDTSALLSTSTIKAQIYNNESLTEQTLTYSASGEASVTVSLTAGQVVKLYAGTSTGNGEYWLNAFSTADEGNAYLYTVSTTGSYVITTHAGTNKPYFTVTAA